MALREQVRQLVDLGPFPPADEADEQEVDKRGAILNSIAAPITPEEAHALLSCFGSDDGFGLAWTLLHLIETAPLPPLTHEPAESENEWIRRLWARAHR